MFKAALGLEPTPVGENVYIPSPTALAAMAKAVHGYKKHDFERRYSGTKKVLVVCAEQNELRTENGKVFLTGNHPVETYVPLLHLESAGIGYDLATSTGKSAKLEEWAIPKDDEAIAGILERTKALREKPLSFAEAIENMKQGHYSAVFIPGGHGAVLGLPEDKNLKEILGYFKAHDLHIVSLCHGPAAFLAAAEPQAPFIFDGYSIAAFPDLLDKQAPKLGYLPGPMPWLFCERLEALGVKIVNKLATGATHVDRKLITGDGPMAANELGRLAGEALLG